MDTYHRICWIVTLYLTVVTLFLVIANEIWFYPKNCLYSQRYFIYSCIRRKDEQFTLFSGRDSCDWLGLGIFCFSYRRNHSRFIDYCTDCNNSPIDKRRESIVYKSIFWFQGHDTCSGVCALFYLKYTVGASKLNFLQLSLSYFISRKYSEIFNRLQNSKHDHCGKNGSFKMCVSRMYKTKKFSEGRNSYGEHQ